MSKATEYAESAMVAEGEVRAAVARQDAMFMAAQRFECGRISMTGAPAKVTARVRQDGSLELSGLLPADKVADFVKWLVEVYEN